MLSIWNECLEIQYSIEIFLIRMFLKLSIWNECLEIQYLIEIFLIRMLKM